jgi:hypothetical protein
VQTYDGKNPEEANKVQMKNNEKRYGKDIKHKGELNSFFMLAAAIIGSLIIPLQLFF